MNRNETLKLLAVIKVAYPNSFNKLTKADLEALITLWERQFKDYDFNIVMAAIDSIIASDTSSFMPQIGQIKEMVNKITKPEELTELEAWALVKKAVGRSGYYSQEEFDKLPPTIQKLVGSPRQLYEWSQTDSDEVNTVIASNFQRSYRNRIQQEKEMIALPNEVKNMIASMQVKMLKE